MGDRRGRRPGVRRRLVVPRPARLRPPGAAPVRRGDDLSCRSLAEEPDAGHAAHARAHAHYETGDHAAGLAWMDAWVTGDGAGHRQPQPLLLARRAARALAGRPRRRTPSLRRAAAPRLAAGLPGAGRHRLAALPLGADARAPTTCPTCAGRSTSSTGPPLERPATPFLGHARRGHPARARRRRRPRLGWRRWAARHPHPAQREVVAPLARRAVRDGGRRVLGGRRPARARSRPRCGGSAARTRSARSSRRPGSPALLRADRYDEARDLLDRRLDRRHSPRDAAWRRTCAS